MNRKTITWLTLLLGLGLFAGFILSACSSGVPQADFDALKQQISAKEREIAGLQDQLQAAKASGQQVTVLQGQLTAKEKEVADLKSQLQTAQSAARQVSTLREELSAKDKDLSAKTAELTKAGEAVKLSLLTTRPNSPPRAAPTPRPPGVTPPPPPVPNPPQVFPIAFYVDVVTAGAGESAYNVDASMSCVRSGVFKRGMHIVWRMIAVDTSTGKELQGTDMESVLVKLPNGVEKRLGYGRHGPTAESPWFWTGSWDVPPDYPLGKVDYSIVATTKSGKVGTFKELTVGDSPLTIID